MVDYTYTTSQLETLPPELLLTTLSSLEPRELQKLKCASSALSLFITGHEDYLVRQILRKQQYPEALLFEQSGPEEEQHFIETTLRLAVACMLELKHLQLGSAEMDVGIVQKLQLPPSLRLILKNRVTKFELPAGVIAPYNSRGGDIVHFSNLKDVLRVGPFMSFSRASARSAFRDEWRRQYNSVRRLGGLNYATFLQALNEHLNAITEDLQWYVMQTSVSTTHPTDRRPGVVYEFLEILYTFGITNPELGYSQEYLDE